MPVCKECGTDIDEQTRVLNYKIYNSDDTCRKVYKKICSGCHNKHSQVRRRLAKENPRGSVCEICGRPAQCMDHCHRTLVFKGWLCTLCNTSLGGLGDSKPGLYRAILYLSKGIQADELVREFREFVEHHLRGRESSLSTSATETSEESGVTSDSERYQSLSSSSDRESGVSRET